VSHRIEGERTAVQGGRRQTIFDYLAAVRGELVEAKQLLNHAIRDASNILTLAGLEQLRDRVVAIERDLDAAVAMR
jgi:hypothetical protein